MAMYPCNNPCTVQTLSLMHSPTECRNFPGQCAKASPEVACTPNASPLSLKLQKTNHHTHPRVWCKDLMLLHAYYVTCDKAQTGSRAGVTHCKCHSQAQTHSPFHRQSRKAEFCWHSGPFSCRDGRLTSACPVWLQADAEAEIKRLHTASRKQPGRSARPSLEGQSHPQPQTFDSSLGAGSLAL